MYLLNVLHKQWLILALCSGLIVMLGIVLIYTAGWRPRPEEREKSEVPLNSADNLKTWYLGTVPWILTATFIAITVWTFLYPVLKSFYPPNW